MRSVLLICSVALLGACATAPEQSSQASQTASGEGLPTSKLAPGQCGLFGWTTGDTREFVFYADAKTARYASLDGPRDLSAQTPFPATQYTDTAGQTVELRLGEGEAMTGGTRYPGARVVTLTEQGWERLQPVAIVRTCQPL